MDFVALDVETANADVSSICQIGLVRFEGGSITGRWSWLLDPQSHFDPVNISIHGITPARVTGAPTFAAKAEELRQFLQAPLVCHHTAFDRTSILAASRRHGIEMPEVRWLDTARVVRRVWPERSRSGYGLRPVADMLGIRFLHHDAVEDARAAGEILVHALRISGLSLSDLNQPAGRTRVAVRPKQKRTPPSIECSEGPLLGQTVVFAGKLASSRQRLADLTIMAGGRVSGTVETGTTIMVIPGGKCSGVDDGLPMIRGAGPVSAENGEVRSLERGQEMRQPPSDERLLPGEKNSAAAGGSDRHDTHSGRRSTASRRSKGVAAGKNTLRILNEAEFLELLKGVALGREP